MGPFTFVLDYRGGTYISQFSGPDVKAALARWVREVDLDPIFGLTNKSRAALIAGFDARDVVPVSEVENVWCVSGAVRGHPALLHIVATRSRSP